MPPNPSPDPQQLYRMLEALLRAPGTGQAVAETMICQAIERDLRCMVSDLRARRAQSAQTRALDERENARPRSGTPWARPA
jgi:hypothetical protein